VKYEMELEETLVKINRGLQRSDEELKNLSEELEDRVRARTSELKTREAALFQSEQHYKDYAVASSDWQWEMNEDLRFSYCSSRFVEITGVDTQILLDKNREETGISDVDPIQWQDHLDDLHSRNAFRNFIPPRQNRTLKHLGFRSTAFPISTKIEPSRATVEPAVILPVWSNLVSKLRPQIMRNQSFYPQWATNCGHHRTLSSVSGNCSTTIPRLHSATVRRTFSAKF
jgi:PAS domain-containing protein